MPNGRNPGQPAPDPRDKFVSMLLPEKTDLSKVPDEVKDKIIDLIISLLMWFLGKKEGG